MLYCQKALEIERQTLGELHPRLAITYNNIGVAYGKKGDYDNELYYCKKALHIWTQAFGIKHPYIIHSYSNIGLCHSRKEEYDTALSYYNRSLDIGMQIFGKEHATTVMNYIKIGECYIEKGEYKQSLIELKKALETGHKVLDRNHYYMAKAYLTIGYCYYNLEDWEQALIHYQKAIQAYCVDFTSDDLSINPSSNISQIGLELVRLLGHKGSAFLRWYRAEPQRPELLKTSLSMYRDCINLMDSIRVRYSSGSSKSTYTEESRTFIEEALVVAHGLYKITGEDQYLEVAFGFAEKAKDFLLFDAIKRLEADQFAGVPKELLEKEHHLKVSLAHYQKQRFDEFQKGTGADKEKLALWDGKIFQYHQSYDTINQLLENNYPDYYQLKYDLSTLSTKAIREHLGTKTALIEYFIGKKNTYAFVLTQRTQFMLKLTEPQAISRKTDSLRQMLNKLNFTRHPERSFQRFNLLSHKLYQLLIAPLTDTLHSLGEPIEKLLIIPDGVTGYLPFEVLVKNSTSDTTVNYRGLDYLLKSFAIHYGFAAKLHFREKSRKHSNHKKGLIAFAPDYSSASINVGFQDTTVSLSPLKGASREIKQLMKIIQGTFYGGTSASEKNFKHEAGLYKVIHLASHAVLNDQNPLYSRFIFSQPRDSTEDGYLYTYELFNLELQADLAVLSACHTGAGQLVQSEGIMSLSRGFAYAGCPSMLMSLWGASDDLTEGIMTSFYEKLTQRQSKDEALRNAKLEHLNTGDAITTHPFYWAGFVTIGNPEAVVLPKAGNRNTVLLLLLTTAGIVFIIFLRFRKKTPGKKPL